MRLLGGFREVVLPSTRICGVLAVAIFSVTPRVNAQTNVAITVRHAPLLNCGRIEGSLQQSLGESCVINSGTVLAGDLLVPGTPAVKLNGHPVFGGVISGTGGTTSSGYSVTLNGGVTLRYLRTRTDPVSLPAVAAPPPPAGARNVTLNVRGQSPGDFTTLRNLTLNGSVGLVPVPPGTYGNFSANSGTGFVLGVAGGNIPVPYHLQNLTLNGCAELRVVGPIILTVANAVILNGAVGDTIHPAWLQLRVASGGVTLNGGSSLGAMVAVPSGTLIINGNSVLIGNAACDRFTLNGGGRVRWAGAVNQPPVAEPQTVITIEDAPVHIGLKGSDSDRDALAWSIVTPPAHGHLSGIPPDVTYTPDANFNGADSFAFRVNDGQANSASAVVNIVVGPVNDAPSFVKGADQQVDEDSGPQTVAGWATAILAGPPEESHQQAAFVVTNDNPLLFASQPSLSAGGVLTYTPATNAFGRAIVTVRLQDEGGTGDGGTDTSAPQVFTITIRPVNDPPTVAIIVPAPDSPFEEGTPIQISVSSNDIDGTITRIVILADGVVVGELPRPPFPFAWNGATVGRHVLTAVAYDNDGASATSAPVAVSILAVERGPIGVDAGPDKIISLPNAAALTGTLSIPNVVAGAPTNAVWSKLSGPGPVAFSKPNELLTQAEFGSPGSYVLRLAVGYADSHRSDTASVVVLPERSEPFSAVRSNQGIDFWLTFLENYHYSLEPRRWGLNLVITSDSDTTGVVTIPEEDSVTLRHFAVKAGAATVVPITDYGGGTGLTESDVIRTNAIHLTAADEVAVYALNYLDSTTDGYTALPTSLLGTEYLVLGYKNTTATWEPAAEDGSYRVIGGTQFAIAATENDTAVTITPSFDSGSRARGVSYQITLHRGETYRLIDETTAQGDFTGTLITATKPIAVFAGHKCANLPDGFRACDHLVEQLPPVTTWGRRFVTMPLATRRNGDTFRIVAAKDATLIALDGEVIGRLDRGEFLERIIVGPAEILAGEPVLVARFANSSEFDGATGDPFMMLVPPVEQSGNHYTFATPQLFDYWAGEYVDFFDDYLNVTIRTGDDGTVVLDGNPISSNVFVPIGNSGFSGGQMRVAPGTHRLTAPVPFGAGVYGWADYESYAYVGGIYSGSVETGTQLSLSQVTPYAVAGTEKVIVARVTNGRGTLLPDIGVTFVVSGANPSQRAVKTTRFGEATFTYAGAQIGADVIKAALADIERTVTNEWLAAGFNPLPAVFAGSSLLVNFGETAQLNGIINDDGLPAGDLLSANWRALNGPAEVVFDDPRQTSTQASFGLPGVYRLELTASDSRFSTRSLVTVTVNALPEVRIAGGTFSDVVEVGETGSIAVQASDYDGTVVKVELFDGALRIGESDAADNADVYTFQWTVPDSGIHHLTAVAVDDRGASGVSTPMLIRGNSPPSISITIPTEGQVVTALSPTEISADASDIDGTVTAVYYFANDEYIGQGSGPNVTLLWTPATVGAFTLVAVAVDDDDARQSSALRHFEVRAPAPTIALDTILPDPERGSLVGFPLVLTAESRVASPFTIDRVEFYASSQLIGIATNPPHVLFYAPTNPGVYTFFARAYADSGAWADSAPVIVQSVPYLQARWDNLADGEWIPLGVARRLAIQADDPGGIFGHVTFLVNGAPLEESVFSYADWTPGLPGACALQARVTDMFGNNYFTDPLTVRVAELHPPRVRIVTPANWSRFAQGSPISFEVEALDDDGVVTNLTLTRFSTPGASSSDGSLRCVWTNLPPGEHAFTAVATDETGQTGEATVRILVEQPLNDSLLPPQNLLAEALGCNAARVKWTRPSGDLPQIFIIERADGSDDVWMPVAYVPADQTSIQDHFLQPSTRYRYRSYSKNANGERSVDSGIAEARTRACLPRFVALDLAESLVDAGTITLASADQPSADGRLRRVRYGLRRIDNIFLTVGPEYLSGLIPLGLSDNNRVLVINRVSANDRRTFLWRPEGNHQQFDRKTFEPYRLALPGVPAGTRLSVVHDSQGQDVAQYHAGLWIDDFLDFTPDVSLLRVPAIHNLMNEPYVTGNLLTDVNVAGVCVGQATWTYFESDQPDSPLLVPPVSHATVWAGLGQPARDFGALQLLNNESEFLAINDAGDIVGLSRILDSTDTALRVTHAVRSHLSLATLPGDKLTDLGTLGGIFSAALSINRPGWAVGYSTVQPEDPIDQTRAVYWEPDETFPRELAGFGSGLKTYGWAINDNYWIAGDAVQTDGPQHAALWTLKSSTNRIAGFDLSDLNERESSSDWLLTSARYLNRDGFIAGQGWHTTTVLLDGVPEVQAPVPRAFLLVPDVSLAVDYNRDGKIELNEKDDLPKETPYQFWVNDDTDRGEEASGKSDIPGARTGLLEFDGRDPNYSDFQVNGACDLIDWFLVYLNITNLLALLPPEVNEYRLTHAEGALNFVYTDLRPDEGGRYLTNALNAGFGPDLDQPSASAVCLQVTGEGVPLSPAFLEKIRGEGKGVLLFEARQLTEQPLRLEVWNQRRLAAVIELPLKISGVEDMYGWVNLRGELGQAPDRLSSYLHQANRPLSSREDRSVVFVHGYNVNERESRGWTAEMFKRLWWSGSNARFYGVSWHGDESQIASVSLNFQANVINAFLSAPTLATFVNSLANQGDVTLIGHSLGNLLASVAIQDEGAQPSRFFMVDAAVAMEAYLTNAEPSINMINPRWKSYESRLFSSEWYRLFPADDDRSRLTWRGRLGDVLNRTSVYNFYSSGEEILKNMDIRVNTVLGGLARGVHDLGLGVTGSYAWGMEETLKGTGLTGYLLSSSYGGWKFNSDWGTLIMEDATLPPLLILPSPGEATAANYPDAILRTKPFFHPGPAELYGADASLQARLKRTQLLAEMFPALTVAVGRNRLVRSEDRDAVDAARKSFNMNKLFQTGWPAERLGSSKYSDNWLHSDVKNIAFLYNHGIFNMWVGLGDLK